MSSATMPTWVAHPLSAVVERALTRLVALEGVKRVAVMPDVHLAEEVCVGVAVATDRWLLPAAVGSDLGCGMAAIPFDLSARDALSHERISRRILRQWAGHVPILRAATRDAVPLPANLEDYELSAPALESAKRRLAVMQCGSLGRGNHFVELQADEQGQLWLMVHTGSRGMGQQIRHWHERKAADADDGDGLVRIEADTVQGRDYLHDLQWALEYAKASRHRILRRACAAVSEITGAVPQWDFLVDCHHNFVRREEHEGTQWWVHRKGAISARDGEPGIIPGSMGTASFLVSGRGNTESLCTSSHGAGRAMSRTEAKQRISLRHFEQQMRGIIYDEGLLRRLRDEAPDAYKPIAEVMSAQRELTRITHRLRPLVSFKGV